MKKEKMYFNQRKELITTLKEMVYERNKINLKLRTTKRDLDNLDKLLFM